MIVSLSMGYVAVRRRDVLQHQDWMLRGYALGMGAGWVINVIVAEWIIARRRAVRVASPNVALCVALCVALYVALFVALLALMCVRPLAVHAQDIERLPKTDHASAIDGVLDEPMWRGYNEAR